MKTNMHVWSYPAHFFVEWERFQKNVVEKIKTDISCLIAFFPESRAVYEIMWKNTADRSEMAIWRMRITCRIPKATNIHSEYVTLIAFPLQQWLHERASMLHYT